MEIKSGVNAGDEVISGSYSAISRKLKNGAKVVIDKETKEVAALWRERSPALPLAIC